MQLTMHAHTRNASLYWLVQLALRVYLLRLMTALVLVFLGMVGLASLLKMT
jgi:hypothetical protein